MSVISILPIALALLTVASPVSGDFDGDGKQDTAAIIIKADGEHGILVTFANGRLASVGYRVDSGAKLEILSAGLIDALCRPIVKDVPACTGQLAGRDRQGLWIRRIGGPKVQGLAVWRGSDFLRVESLWSEDAAAAASETAMHDKSATYPSRKANAGRLRSVLELDVSSTGKLQGCRVVERSGVPELDAKACSITLEKAKFRPAQRGNAGKRLTMRTEIVWRAQ